MCQQSLQLGFPHPYPGPAEFWAREAFCAWSLFCEQTYQAFKTDRKVPGTTGSPEEQQVAKLGQTQFQPPNACGCHREGLGRNILGNSAGNLFKIYHFNPSC